jgi:hypothetical protein
MNATFDTQPPVSWVGEHAQERPAPPDNAAARRMAAADTLRYIDLRETYECMSRVLNSVSDRRRHTLDEPRRLCRELDEAERLGRAPDEIHEIAERMRLSLDDADDKTDLLNRVSDAASKRMHRALDETKNLVTRRSSVAGVRTGLRRMPRTTRITRTGRHTTASRVAAFGAGPKQSGSDDGGGGGEPPLSRLAAPTRLEPPHTACLEPPAHPASARRSDLLQVGDDLTATLPRRIGRAQ